MTARKAVRSDDGRLQRSERARETIAKAVLEGIILAHGDFQPKSCVISETLKIWTTSMSRRFGSRRLLLSYVARAHAAAIVDAVGLEPAARATLSERDEKALAFALLAGRRLERP